MADILPPHSAEAEEAVLGSLLVDPLSTALVAPMLRAEDFYLVKNRWVYEAVLGQGTSADVLTVADALGKQGLLEDAGGDVYLAQLSAAMPTALNVEAYARIVAELAQRRRMINAAGQIAKLGYDQSIPLTEAQGQAWHALMAVNAGGMGQRARRMGAVAQDVWSWLERVSRGEVVAQGIRTGWKDLDAITGGLARTEVSVLASRPSMGKSTLMVNLCDHAAMVEGLKVAVFSLEMNDRTWASRSMAGLADVDFERVRWGKLRDEDWDPLARAAQKMAGADIWIDDEARLGVSDISMRAKRLHQEHGIDMVVVDYLQMVRWKGTRQESRDRELGQVMDELKALAKDINAHVMVACMVGRGVEQRADKRPTLADLRESGNIEAFADVALGLYRDEFYNPDTNLKGLAEIICMKNRNGPVGNCYLSWDKARQRYGTRAVMVETMKLNS